MLRYVVRRLLLLVPILLGVSILIFAWIRALPGSPAESLLGERATPQLVAQYKKRYGLDKPIVVQYWEYLKTTFAKRDLGVSIETHRPVAKEIRERFPATMELSLAAMIVAVGLGIPLRFLAAKRHNGFFDQATLFTSLLGISVPIFVLAIILKYVFAVRLGWLPSVGRIDVTNLTAKHPTDFYVLDAIIARDWSTLVDVVKHLALPAVALGSIPLAIVVRITRAAVLDVQNEDYVRTARAKGAPEARVIRSHVLRNALLPVVTMLGMDIGLALGGAIFTETVFGLPGLGQIALESIQGFDLPVTQGIVVFGTLSILVFNLLVDLLYAVIDPRIRLT